MTVPDRARILAFDPHPKSFGFVVFEGAKLLDWGAKSFPKKVRVPPGSKIRSLVAEYLPDALVFKYSGHRRSEQMVNAIKSAARMHRIVLHPFPAQAVRQVFVNCSNKDQIASAICERFPELLSLLPPRRKNWMTEDYRMKIFQAAATGIAYISHKTQDT